MDVADVAPEHLLAGIIRLGKGVGWEVLVDLGVDLAGLRDFIWRDLKSGPAPRLVRGVERYRINVAKLRTRDLHNVAEVVDSLAIREPEKGLSQGERRMLIRAREMMADPPSNKFLAEPTAGTRALRPLAAAQAWEPPGWRQGRNNRPHSPCTLSTGP